MPGARNIPFAELLDNGCFLPQEKLTERFAEQMDAQQSLIFSCGSGVTACIGGLAAELAGAKQISIYDGSWSEWGRETGYRVVQGPE